MPAPKALLRRLCMHIPNAICVLRMVLAWPIVTALLGGRFGWALGLLVLAGCSDFLDGFLAKHFSWQSRLGGVLDPLADKVLLVSVFVTLTSLGLVPLWLSAVVIGRDVLIVGGGLIYQTVFSPLIPDPTGVSKFNTGAQLVFSAAVMGNQALGSPPRGWLVFGGAVVLVTSFVSGLDYVLRWSRKASRVRRIPSGTGL